MLKYLTKSKDSSTGLRKYLESYPLTSFFVMAYLFSWVVLIPFILSQWGIFPKTKAFDIFFVANAFVGPMLAAYIMFRTLEGKESWKKVRKSIISTKVSLKWYFFTLIFIPAVMFLGMVILNGGIPTFHSFTSKFFVTYLISFVVTFFLGGPLPEEIGWRGFALPRLQSKFGPFKATLLLSVLWAFWHLPHFLTVAQRGGPGSDLSLLYIHLPIFILMCLPISIILTWVYNCHRGNLFIVMLVHTSVNTFSLVQAHSTSPVLKDSDLFVGIGLGFVALLILIFTRGNLGYRQITSEIGFSNNENISK
ncbi:MULTISPECIES: CPBP family intramembrane glutamic endopeptidase [Bacillus cereus group]|uniref:CPBP family intramembrane glutamic endopeptidase n=1 Tax=Bacillus cereus group TaxID=86661 RepID=UPI00053544E5|nr:MULTISPECIES: type II CAAX endopeptidase family protein [Bacillus cereus group]MEB8637824.1 type II CAAX endopeptidase family protein [Bacillus cereus]MEB8746597.1 type II CAAX endopeptidase family protein [Bacillus cereus]MEB8797129.1 type II CAAX endopeptidase family protein [Bacillus cereus]MEB8808714.1 type II CAAX endopeptidase family protein [Bacillus cereus]MEB8902866.1 type II CAAX endopeptidase family protein [Bacillus cereus]